MNGKRAILAFGCALTFVCGVVRGAEWELDLDARLVDSDGKRSFINGGLGELRYSQGKSGLELGRARFALSQPIGDVVSLYLDASAWGDQDKSPIDLTEAYAEYRPYPRAGFRARVRAGAFYAPISLENRSAGWDTPYTLSSSAINTWIAEEVRTIGFETQIDWLGTRLGHSFDLALVGSVYGWNDDAGGSIASHGFALHDRQTTLFGRLGRPGVAPLNGREMFHEIDDRVGYYGGLEFRYLDRLTVRALHYDNRADPSVYSVAAQDYAWNTSFDSAGLRFESADGWTVISQWLEGETYVTPPAMELEWPFKAKFLLVSRRIGRQSVSLRYDEFWVGFSANAASFGDQNGHAWTLAYVAEPTPHWRFTLEALKVDSNLNNRADYLNQPIGAKETGLQLAIRYAIGSAVR